MNHIELFAGCGGLCLGLHAEGYELLFANELSPMASETFAYNFFGTDLPEELSHPDGQVEKVKWLSSSFHSASLGQRLRENPHEFPERSESNSDLKGADDLNGNLIVGSIVELNRWVASRADVKESIRNAFGRGRVDLVSGGPPCQSFSMAGLRDYNNSRNVLPHEFADFVEMAQPRFALLENVTGILRPFQVDGEEVYAWIEVAKKFASIGYVPLCLHVNAKYVGVAQNRPRFLMILFNRSVFDDIYQDGENPALNSSELELFGSAKAFFDRALSGKPIHRKHIRCFDVENEAERALYKTSFLAPLMSHAAPFSVKEAIDDLCSKGRRKKPSLYATLLNENLGEAVKAPVVPHKPALEVANHDMRANSPHVKRRFRIYQIMREVTRSAQREVAALLSGKIESLSDQAFVDLSQFKFSDGEEGTVTFTDKNELEAFLIAHKTKKQTQRALDPALPAPAALSIPDDACHYGPLRTLSVREMARIQSFPDKFVFRSKITTGGTNRKFEVPQYTQVGNAVPPLLGRAIGKVFLSLNEKVRSTGFREQRVAYDLHASFD